MKMKAVVKSKAAFAVRAPLLKRWQGFGRSGALAAIAMQQI
jgi:hypothetical protein